jgi:hypothetical protein
MRKASTRLLEQGIQTPSPAPDLIPAETKINRGLTWDWYSKRGHFIFYVNESRGKVKVIRYDSKDCPHLNLEDRTTRRYSLSNSTSPYHLTLNYHANE